MDVIGLAAVRTVERAEARTLWPRLYQLRLVSLEVVVSVDAAVQVLLDAHHRLVAVLGLAAFMLAALGVELLGFVGLRGDLSLFRPGAVVAVGPPRLQHRAAFPDRQGRKILASGCHRSSLLLLQQFGQGLLALYGQARAGLWEAVALRGE